MKEICAFVEDFCLLYWYSILDHFPTAVVNRCLFEWNFSLSQTSVKLYEDLVGEWGDFSTLCLPTIRARWDFFNLLSSCYEYNMAASSSTQAAAALRQVRSCS